MSERKLAHPHDLLVRHFLAEPDLAADLIFHYVTADIVKLLDLSALRCESPVDVDKN
ncbi:Rpn family recombination-promoting nuclease/putative transposase, partial [Desulfosarcina sp. OttesenSCG-928-G10]|nr:Rpn family recombination-promoting nuclease/putative transposase [Desulfosarcina sp. OttesenSCG-928-G10]